jgi:hypothetical protein
MDQLDKLIASKRSERADLNSKVEAAKAKFTAAKSEYDVAVAEFQRVEIELRAYEHACAIRPGDDGARRADPEDLIRDSSSRLHIVRQPRGGRQPGSISQRWRLALSDFVALGNAAVEMERFYLVTRGRLGLAEASVRERVRNYVVQGIMEEIDGKVRVSQASIDKFGLPESSAQEKTTPSDADEAANGFGDGVDQRVPGSQISCDPQADRH